jgi:hypothetical protein
MAELLTRRGTPWSKYEDSLLLEYDAQGMNMYQIANMLDRTPNAIRLALNRINYAKSQSKMNQLTPSYTPEYTVIEIQDKPIQQDKTAVELDGEFILTMRDKGMSDEYIKKMMFSKASCVTTPTKNDCCIA